MKKQKIDPKNYYLSTFDIEDDADIKEIQKFYYQNPSEHIVFGRNEEMEPYNYVALREKESHTILAITSFDPITDHLVKMWSTVVEKSHRGIGLGTLLNQMMEDMLRIQGFGKISSNIYVENLSSIILKLKRGYIIEGTLYNHDFEGQHEYILGLDL